MSSDLGMRAATVPPPASRVARPGWRDPRLWVGVLLVTASVVAGARLLAAADDTVTVWAFDDDRGTGSAVVEGDLTTKRVRFADPADLDRYFLADTPLPDGLVLTRAVGAGELLARSAVGSATDAGLLQVPLEVDPNRVPPDVGTGSVVDVWLADGAGARGPGVGSGGAGRGTETTGPALSAVTVVAAPEYDDTFAVTGARQLVVAVGDETAAEFERLLASLQEPIIRILQRS
ncbi:MULTISPECIES: flagellar biosynthesis protein FlgA [Nocardioides]|uniref:SAF domain-containing protein n=1 Tax=Nocardioides vastitatis TaxID=2568655 RepID=A0ABW0ZFW1_9ACTN|nr:flagellar biosynthesis protein FlgA [Nocardioides sp.]THJ14476.1 flagellar biosynthesis protein FlgA [Nocardioides sp.]